MLKFLRSFALFIGVLALLPGFLPVSVAAAAADPKADPWQAVVSDYDNAPSFLIAVDKQAQELTAFERQSPMRVFAKYPITSGKATGDKLREGDHKTPEGVYFVTRHITSGLNYTLYGKEAYPVNYPNPVDRLRKKTGGGIWLHGKGIPLTPRDTRGCVAMNNEDIASLGKKIDIGQPVAFASTLSAQSVPGTERAADIARLENLVQDWARAWSERSTRMFDFYDADSYTLSGSGNFKAFRAQKERLFKSLAWVRTTVSDVQILEGPGYWVTWFNQDYKASNLSTSGTRRLYWQKNAKGEFHIVGMEWLPGLKSPVLLASRGEAELPSVVVQATPVVPVAEKAPQAQPPAAIKAEEKPMPEVEEKPAGKPLPAPQLVASVETKPLPATPRGGAKDVPVFENEENGKSMKNAENGDSREEALLILEQWRSSWESGIVDNYARFYAPDARQGGRGLKQFLAQKRHSWAKVKPSSVVIEDISLTDLKNGYRVRFLQTYTNTVGYSDKGIKTLIMERRGGILRIVREDWTPVTN